MQNTMDLQEQFLDEACSQRAGLTVFLMNGFQMRGVVTAHDSFTVLLDCEGKQELVYKHAISTIIPARALPLIGKD